MWTFLFLDGIFMSLMAYLTSGSWVPARVCESVCVHVCLQRRKRKGNEGPPMSCHFLCAWWFRSRFMTSRLRLSDCKNETTDGWTSPGGIHTWNTEQWAASPLSYFSENIYESARIKGSAEAVAVCRGVKEYVCLCDLTSSPCLMVRTTC